jgi:hypothetical protein
MDGKTDGMKKAWMGKERNGITNDKGAPTPKREKKKDEKEPQSTNKKTKWRMTHPRLPTRLMLTIGPQRRCSKFVIAIVSSAVGSKAK